MQSPFSQINDQVNDQANEDAYKRWRAAKLEHFPSKVEALMVEVSNIAALSLAEKAEISTCIQRAGFAIYKGPELTSAKTAKVHVQALGEQFGLSNLDQNPYADEDAITPLQVSQKPGRKMYIPYTNKALNWHTDGYYNEQARTIHAMILHCVRRAGQGGGENRLFDPEMAYLLLRDKNPDFIKALQNTNVMTIPGNAVDDQVTRGDSTGPVFSVHDPSGALHMRYTARKRNVIWAENELTEQALAFLHDILAGPHVFQHHLNAGEGLISNNILHTRSNFEDGFEKHQKRLMLRARFWDRLVL